MKKLKKISKLFSLEDNLLTINNKFILPGDFLSFKYGNYWNTFLCEYVSYKNNTIILLHKPYKISYNCCSFDSIYMVYSDDTNTFDNVIKLKNQTKLLVLLKNSNIQVQPSIKENISNLNLNKYKHIQKGILYRTHWKYLPELHIKNCTLLDNTTFNIPTTLFTHSNVYLQYKNHKEFLWNQTKFN